MQTTRRAAPRILTKTAKKTAPKQDAAKEAVKAPVEALAVAVAAPEPTVNAGANVGANVDPVTTPVNIAEVDAEPQFGFISPARVRHYLDKESMNKCINDAYKLMKSRLSALATAKQCLATGTFKQLSAEGVETEVALTPAKRAECEATVAEVTPLEREYVFKMDALSRERERFSSSAPTVLSIVCDEIVRQLVSHTIESAINDDRKIILNRHMHCEGVEKLSLYKLVKDLPSFKRGAELYAESLEQKREEELKKAIRTESWRDFRTRYNQSLARKKKVPAMVLPIKAPELAAEPVVAEEHVDDELDLNNKSSFVFYVVRECKSITNSNKAYNGIRISTEIKKYLSDILIEFIRKMSTQVYLTTDAMTRKTVNKNAIMRTIQKLMVDGHKSVETITYVHAEVLDPFKKEEELAKKAEQEKLGLEYKIDLSKLPKVAGYAAVKTVTYPTSGYSELYELVQEKLKQYADAEAKAAEEAKAAKLAAAPTATVTAN